MRGLDDVAVSAGTLLGEADVLLVVIAEVLPVVPMVLVFEMLASEFPTADPDGFMADVGVLVGVAEAFVLTLVGCSECCLGWCFAWCFVGCEAVLAEADTGPAAATAASAVAAHSTELVATLTRNGRNRPTR
jgi:hypothetical protein